MLSSGQFRKNIINEFFKIAITILKVKSIEELDEQLDAIKEFESHPTVWKDEFEQHSDELKTCEENLIKTLYGLSQFVRYRLGTSTVDQVKKYLADNITLKNLCDESAKPKLGIVYAMNVHMAITAEFCYMMDEMWSVDTDSTVMTIESVMNIIETVAMLKKDKNSIIIYPSDVIPIQHCIDAIDSVDVLLTDDQPESSQCRLYLLALNELIVTKLFQLRTALQPEEADQLASLRKFQDKIIQTQNLSKACKEKKKLEVITTLLGHLNDEVRDIKTLLAMCRDRRIQLDSLIYKLNLASHPKKRKKYNDHLKKHEMGQHYVTDTQFARNKRVPVVSGLIGYEDPVYQIMCATQLLFIYVYHLEYTFYTFKVLKHNNDFNKLPIINSILRQCKNIHFDCRALLAQVAQYTSTSEDARIAERYLHVISKVATVITYTLDSIPNAGQLKSFMKVNYTDLDLEDLQSDSLASAFGAMLHIKNQTELDLVGDFLPRLLIINRVKCELDDLLKKYDVLDKKCKEQLEKIEKFGNNSEAQKVYQAIYKKRELAAHFISDYYIAIITSANCAAEISILGEKSFVDKMSDLAVHSHHRSIYKLLCEQLRLRNQDPLIIEHEAMVEMFEQVKPKINNINKQNVNRINTHMFSYFLDRVFIVLGYMSLHGDDIQKQEALVLQYNLNLYLTNLYNQTIQYTDDIMPVDSGYTAVRLEDKNFLDEKPVKASTKPASKKTTKKELKAIRAEANRAKVVTVTAPVNLKPLQLIYKEFNQIVEQFKRINPENYFDEMVKFFCSLMGQTRDVGAQLRAFVGATQLLNFEFVNSEGEIKRRIALQRSILGQGKLLPLLTEAQKTTYNKELNDWSECRSRYAPGSISTFYIIEKITTSVAMPKPKEKKRRNRKPLTAVAAPTLFSEQKVVEQAPAPKDPFYGKRVDNNHPLLRGFKFPVSTIHQPLLDILLQNDIATFAHGGSISDLVFKKHPRDLDLVCCADKQNIVNLLQHSASKPEYCIKRIKVKDNNDIITINFDKEQLQKALNRRIKNSELKLEIHCRDLDQLQALQSMAGNFVLNTMFFYDFRCQSIIDVDGQFENLFSKQILAGLSDSLHAYFRKNRSRLLDIIYKLTRYFEYKTETANDHVDVKLRRILKKAKSLLDVKDEEPFQMEKFNKLFMQGHARQALLWLRHFKMDTHLFSCMQEADAGNLEIACIRSDDYFTDNDFEYLPEEELLLQRANFMVTAFYNCFIRANDPLKYLLDMDAFHKDCRVFYSSMNFEMKYHQATLNKIVELCARKFDKEMPDILYKDFIDGQEPHEYSDQRAVFEDQCRRHFLPKHVGTDHINNTKLRVKIAEICWEKHLLMIKKVTKNNTLAPK